MAEPIRFGILGCGVIGPHHALAIAGLQPDATLIAVADRDVARAEQLAQQYDAAAYASLDELLRHDGLDAVCICTPSGEHAAHALTVLEAGKHVVIEKPIDVTLEAVDRLQSARQSGAQKVAVISQHRFDTSTRIVHEAVTEGRLGRLTLGAAQVRWWRSQAYYDSGDWRGTWQYDGGGALMNQSIHTIDLLQWIMGPVVEVTAYTGLLAHERIEVEDTAVGIVRFASGALGVIEGTTAAYPGLTARLEIHGDRGSAVIDSDELVYFHSPSTGDEGAAYGAGGAGNQAADVLSQYAADPVGPAAGADPGSLSMAHREQLRDFIAAIREDGEPLVNIEEGRKPVAVILAIYESARTGRPVKVQ
ncbi:MAG: Gfo/Idh/MocA family oxidoreductase [Chloroflexota bacterium]|nr:Gfo/Idh/MocA family oxidoreductase [Chloroflexota bacterium]PLS81660.1 MAG: gfo/Idh/MocA family oxidoreductase [Chloroflexota bacterium]